MVNYSTSPLSAMLAAKDEPAGPGPGDPPVKTLLLPPDTVKPIAVADKRKMIAATGVPFSDRYSKAGNYDPVFMGKIVKAAKLNGVDPNLALSVALQETGMGKIPISSIVHQVYDKAPEGIDQDSYELTRMLKEKMTEGQKLGFKDEAHQIQMFNGMGKLFPRLKINGVPQPESYYGLRVTQDNPLDMRKNPVYGKTVQDLRDNVIKASPEIQQLISENYK